MHSNLGNSKERGAVTVFVTIVMLLLITVLVLGAFAVQHFEYAAPWAMFRCGKRPLLPQTWLSSGASVRILPAAPTAVTDEVINIADDPNSPTDYLVDSQAPVCVRATEVIVTSASSVSLPGMTFGSGWDTVWELDSTARNEATGGRARVVQGVRVQLTDTQKENRCPDV